MSGVFRTLDLRGDVGRLLVKIDLPWPDGARQNRDAHLKPTIEDYQFKTGQRDWPKTVVLSCREECLQGVV
jgi:hypothetical protein